MAGRSTWRCVLFHQRLEHMPREGDVGDQAGEMRVEAGRPGFHADAQRPHAPAPWRRAAGSRRRGEQQALHAASFLDIRGQRSWGARPARGSQPPGDARERSAWRRRRAPECRRASQRASDRPAPSPPAGPPGAGPTPPSNAMPASAEEPVEITSSTSSTRRPSSRGSRRGSSHIRRSAGAVEEEAGHRQRLLVPPLARPSGCHPVGVAERMGDQRRKHLAERRKPHHDLGAHALAPPAPSRRRSAARRRSPPGWR